MNDWTMEDAQSDTTASTAVSRIQTSHIHRRPSHHFADAGCGCSRRGRKPQHHQRLTNHRGGGGGSHLLQVMHQHDRCVCELREKTYAPACPSTARAQSGWEPRVMAALLSGSFFCDGTRVTRLKALTVRRPRAPATRLCCDRGLISSTSSALCSFSFSTKGSGSSYRAERS